MRSCFPDLRWVSQWQPGALKLQFHANAAVAASQLHAAWLTKKKGQPKVAKVTCLSDFMVVFWGVFFRTSSSFSNENFLLSLNFIRPTNISISNESFWVTGLFDSTFPKISTEKITPELGVLFSPVGILHHQFLKFRKHHRGETLVVRIRSLLEMAIICSKSIGITSG